MYTSGLGRDKNFNYKYIVCMLLTISMTLNDKTSMVFQDQVEIDLGRMHCVGIEQKFCLCRDGRIE